MGIINSIPDNSNSVLTVNTFNAVFNAITPGRYDFTQTPGNQNQLVYVLQPRSVYVIDSVSWSANIDSLVYQQAIDPTLTVPRVQLKLRRTGQQIYLEKHPFIKFYDSLDLMQFFQTKQKDDQLQVSMEGVFTQPAPIVGLATLQCFLQMTLYEINDPAWIKRYYAQR